jgi:hypothetical protein
VHLLALLREKVRKMVSSTVKHAGSALPMCGNDKLVPSHRVRFSWCFWHEMARWSFPAVLPTPRFTDFSLMSYRRLGPNNGMICLAALASGGLSAFLSKKNDWQSGGKGGFSQRPGRNACRTLTTNL